MLAIINARAVLPDGIAENAVILIKDKKITAIGRDIDTSGADIIDACGGYVGPGFVDIHVHGDGGANRWETNPEAVARHHLRHGSTTMVATMSYGQSRESLLQKTKNVQQLIDDGRLPNVHAVSFEGPYINPERGAKSSEFARKCPDSDEYLPLYDACHGKIAQWMYAPEMDKDGKFADFLKEKGIVTAIGHTNASPVQIRTAVDKGATIATHLYDAMGCHMGDDSWQITGTAQDTAAVGCLISPELVCELISDSRGIHVKPANLKLVYQFAKPCRIALVTDCTICDYDPKDYPSEHFRSTPDLNYNDIGQLSGSRLTMDRAVRNFANHTGASVPELFTMASATPAKAIGIYDRVGSIEVGKDADLVFTDDELSLKKVIFKGEIL